MSDTAPVYPLNACPCGRCQSARGFDRWHPVSNRIMPLCRFCESERCQRTADHGLACNGLPPVAA